MKFVITYTNRVGGSSQAAREDAAFGLELLGRFQPSEAATVHQWVTRCDGNGGFSVIETDDAESMLYDLSLWSSQLDFQIYPVVDVVEAAAVQQRAVEFLAGGD